MHLTGLELGFLAFLWLAMAGLTLMMADRFGLVRGVWLIIGLALGVFAPFLVMLWTRLGGLRGTRPSFERVEPHWPDEEDDDGGEDDDYDSADRHEPHAGDGWERREPRMGGRRERRAPRVQEDWERGEIIPPPANGRGRPGRQNHAAALG